MTLRLADPNEPSIPIFVTDSEAWPGIRERFSPAQRVFADASGFKPTAGRHLLLGNESGAIERAVFAIEPPGAKGRDPFLAGRLPTALPPGVYRFETGLPDPTLAAIAFLLGSYRFTRYRAAKDDFPRLQATSGIDRAHAERVANAVAMGRDLVNTPANDLGPSALEEAAAALGQRYGATIETVRGEDLRARNFPLIHAVGRASSEQPRIIDMRWTGDANGPAVTLVGKGVTFDTGGLDIKSDAGMLLMKKDMGGAATALALAQMIMDARLPLRLRVILPIVENAISGNAFRPGDVVTSRKGPTVEIGNTDAEGRLILADALALADEEDTDYLFDFATLTGAARVALGPDLPPFYTSNDRLAADIATHSAVANDPVWRMPLWAPYDKNLDGKVADISNVGGGGFAGSITAALFLQRFVTRAKAWAHFDVFAWTPAAKPGRPEGGEIQAARMLFDMLRKRWPGAA